MIKMKKNDIVILKNEGGLFVGKLSACTENEVEVRLGFTNNGKKDKFQYKYGKLTDCILATEELIIKEFGTYNIPNKETLLKGTIEYFHRLKEEDNFREVQPVTLYAVTTIEFGDTTTYTIIDQELIEEYKQANEDEEEISIEVVEVDSYYGSDSYKEALTDQELFKQ